MLSPVLRGSLGVSIQTCEVVLELFEEAGFLIIAQRFLQHGLQGSLLSPGKSLQP